MRRYILKNRKPVLCPDLFAWGTWFENPYNRRIKEVHIGEARISTIFLGLDHSFTSVGAPVLFETMIFGGEHDLYQERCCTYEQALTMHKTAVILVQDLKLIGGGKL